METIKVKPWAKDQGDHVLINKDDFDATKHELYTEAEAVDKKSDKAVDKKSKE